MTHSLELDASVRIRPADGGDILWLLEHLERFADAYGTRHKLFGEDSCSNIDMLENLMTSHYFKIATKGKERIGFMAGMLLPHMFNREVTILSEVFWWVLEEHRYTTAASKLALDYIAFGKEHAHMISMTLEADTPIKDETMERLGFKLKEKNFMMEVN